MHLQYKAVAVKQLSKFSTQEKKKILKKLELLIQDPYAGKSLKGELESLRSLRAWPYRIIYEIKNNNLTVFSVIHRQSAY